MVAFSVRHTKPSSSDTNLYIFNDTSSGAQATQRQIIRSVTVNCERSQKTGLFEGVIGVISLPNRSR